MISLAIYILGVTLSALLILSENEKNKEDISKNLWYCVFSWIYILNQVWTKEN